MIAFKPAYLNMILELDAITVNDSVDMDSISVDSYKVLFWDAYDWSNMGNWTVNKKKSNCWVWFPTGSSSSIVSSIYAVLNMDSPQQIATWKGGQILWKLNTIPRVEVFL